MTAEEQRTPFWYPDLRAFVAVATLALLGGVTSMLLFKPMPMTEQAGAVLLTIIGVILGKFGTIVDYYFGSNKEAKDQNETSRSQAATIATMTATVAPVVAAAATNGALETAAWKEADEASTKEALQAYLDKFPTGVNAPEARARIAAKGG